MLCSLVAEKVKKSGKANKSDKHEASKQNDMEGHVEVSTANVDGTADVDEIPSVDEDCSKGMKSNSFTFEFHLRELFIVLHCQVAIHDEMCLMGKILITINSLNTHNEHRHLLI